MPTTGYYIRVLHHHLSVDLFHHNPVCVCDYVLGSIHRASAKLWLLFAHNTYFDANQVVNHLLLYCIVLCVSMIIYMTDTDSLYVSTNEHRIIRYNYFKS